MTNYEMAVRISDHLKSRSISNYPHEDSGKGWHVMVWTGGQNNLSIGVWINLLICESLQRLGRDTP